jgi:hypothetical protein
MYWLVVSTALKNTSQMGLLFPIYEIKRTCSKPPTRICSSENSRKSMASMAIVHVVRGID